MIDHATDKRKITLTVGITLSEVMVPYQCIYPGKTRRSCPDPSSLREGTLISANPKHWSNEAETIKLIKKIMIPYATKTKARLGLGSDQKALLVWDAFRGHLTSAV